VTYYIAGPMRGHPLYNFPAFDAASIHLRAYGHDIISPADMDREHGFDPATSEFSEADYEAAMARDMAAIEKCDGIYLLRGWERSAGARREVAKAIELGLSITLEGE
jgi:hypothetical protein